MAGATALSQHGGGGVKLLDRYIFGAILGSVAMVMAVLLVLAALFLLMGQQDDIGVGSYSALDAVWFVLLNLPQSATELLPIGVLIGTLTGLGGLARGSELTVMRTAGLSVWRIAGSTLIAGVLLAAIGTLLGDWLAPPLQQMANQQKAFGKFENISFAGRGGAWVRDGNRLVNVAQQSGDAQFGGMMVFELSDDHQLLAISKATSAAADSAATWTLSGYRESRFEGDRVVSRRASRHILQSNVSADFLGVAAMHPGQLDTATLYRMIGHMRANGLDPSEQEFAFWARIARNVAIVFAALLAVPFVFGTLRGAGAGARTMIGLLLGIGFFLMQRLLESGAVVFDLHPIVTAWMTATLMGALSLILIARTR